MRRGRRVQQEMPLDTVTIGADNATPKVIDFRDSCDCYGNRDSLTPRYADVSRDRARRKKRTVRLTTAASTRTVNLGFYPAIYTFFTPDSGRQQPRRPARRYTPLSPTKACYMHRGRQGPPLPKNRRERAHRYALTDHVCPGKCCSTFVELRQEPRGRLADQRMSEMRA